MIEFAHIYIYILYTYRPSFTIASLLQYIKTMQFFKSKKLKYNSLDIIFNDVAILTDTT